MGRRQKFNGSVLRALRKDSPYSQFELAELLGISRETVSAIENDKIGTIDNISIDLIRRWYEVCEEHSESATKFNFMVFITKFFGF